MKAWGIVAAAGSGERLGSEVPKAFVELAGIPMLVHSVRAFEGVDVIQGLVVVVPDGWEEATLEALAGSDRFEIRPTTGGLTRQGSIRAGLARMHPSDDERRAVVVHDAARPLASAELIERALDGLSEADGAACAVPLADTIKRADAMAVVETVSREGLWRVQTPQAFPHQALLRAHERARREGLEATDDAALVEHDGGRVVLVPGDERNIKVTTKDDLALAESLFRERS